MTKPPTSANRRFARVRYSLASDAFHFATNMPPSQTIVCPVDLHGRA
ncbi:MAG: hypothetical protein KDA71_13590 [Planctomycetales bacterium]|nr:hypothetical protein [Planctomycetales bacterium]